MGQALHKTIRQQRVLPSWSMAAGVERQNNIKHNSLLKHNCIKHHRASGLGDVEWEPN